MRLSLRKIYYKKAADESLKIATKRPRRASGLCQNLKKKELSTMTKTTILNVFVTNLGKYNEGELCGEWLNLPATDDEIEKLMERIGIDGEEYEEFFITDYESDYGIKCGEYDNLDDLNELAENLSELEDYQLDIIEVLMTEGGYDVERALEKMDDVYVFFDCYNMGQVAEQYCDDCGILDEIPEHLRYYFDFDACGRDMELEGEFYYSNGNYYQVI